MSCESWSGTCTCMEFQFCAAMSCESWSGTCTCMEFQSCVASAGATERFFSRNRRAPCRVRVGRARAHAWSFSPAPRAERRCDGAILFTQSEGAMSCESWSGTCTSEGAMSCGVSVLRPASERRCDGAHVLFTSNRRRAIAMSCESWSGTCTYMEFQSCVVSKHRCDGAVLFTQSEGAMSCESWSGTCTYMEFQSCAASERTCGGAILFTQSEENHVV